MKKAFPFILLAVVTAAGCSSVPKMETVPRVDLERFMIDWYVIAAIPTFIEKEAYNAVESYRLGGDGVVETTFTFRKGGFDGPLKTYRPRGFIRNTETNAEWGMQFVWPFKGEFLIIYLNEEYSQTVIGRSKLDYVWIMAKTPEIPEADYARIVAFLADLGYDTGKIRKVPQKW
jgi:apolipoprotein D and lipocalin family protein